MSGIAGLINLKGEKVGTDLFYVIGAEQGRGEEGTGLSLGLKKGFYTPRPDNKLVHYYWRDIEMAPMNMDSHLGIAHNLYESSGALQPVEGSGYDHRFSMAMDGFLRGFHGKNDAYMRTVFLKEFDDAIKNGSGDVIEAFFSSGEAIMDRLKGRGGYSVVALVDAKAEGEDEQFLVAYRSPEGLKPFCYGERDGTIVFASESVAIDGIDGNFVRDVEPGEMFVVSRKYGVQNKKLRDEPHRHCAFEWIYFAHPASKIEGKRVYAVRKRLGALEARRGDLGFDIMMASPDSGRGQAIGYQQETTRMRMEELLGKAEELGSAKEIKELLRKELYGTFLPFEEGITKNPGAKRTFMVDESLKERIIAARNKFSFVPEVIEGRSVGVGEDSIVRGRVFKDGIVYKISNVAGARSVTGTVSCPPLRYPCARDTESTEFIADGIEGDNETVAREIAEKLELDRVVYATIEDLKEAIGLDDLCLGCFDGNYPVDGKILEKIG